MENINNGMVRRVTCCLLVLAVAGCASVPNAPSTPPVTLAPAAPVNPGPQLLVEVLDGYKRWQGKPADEQRLELAAANEAYARSHADPQRLRLALMLSAPTVLRDDARALAVLSAPSPDTAGGPLPQLASILQQQIGERLREVREEQKRGDELAQKLEALRAVERSIADREQRARPK
jgi:hypothetical protein